MKCIVTAGPSHEPLDRVRRITNFSTGRLGTELGNFLAGRGHEVILMLGEMSSWGGPREAAAVRRFTTTNNLASLLESVGRSDKVDAVFHAAAVSDFAFGKAYQRQSSGELVELSAGKISSRNAPLLVELVQTPKIIARLRKWFPAALLVGWKYEVDGKRSDAVDKAQLQIAENKTDASVANGPGYGLGFGVVTASGNCRHCRGIQPLFETLEELLRAKPS